MTIVRAGGALVVALLLLGGPATGSEKARRGTIVFSAGTYPDLYTVRADGSHLRQLTRTHVVEQSPTWSPDGRSIAYVRAVESESALYRMTADGRKARLIMKEDASASGYLADPAWSPDGRRIAFTSQRFGDVRIWTIGLDGTLVMVTKTFGAHPTWSRDGRRLAYHGLDAAGHGRIFVVDRNGGRSRAITDARVNAEHPVWSPDGRWIAFRALNADWRRHEVDSLVIVSPNGASSRRLVRGGVLFPHAWSPSGDAILFSRRASPTSTSPAPLFTVSVAGGPARLVPGTYGASGASWHR